MATVEHPITGQRIIIPKSREKEWLAAGWLAVAGDEQQNTTKEGTDAE